MYRGSGGRTAPPPEHEGEDADGRSRPKERGKDPRWKRGSEREMTRTRTNGNGRSRRPPIAVLATLLGLLALGVGCEADLPSQGHEMEQLTIIPFDSELTHIVADTDPSRPYVYVSDFQANRVHVISTRDNSIVKSIVVGTKPFTLSLDAARDRLYVGLVGSWAIDAINLNTLQTESAERLQLNFAPYYFVRVPARNRLYGSTVYDTEDHSYYEGTRIVDLTTGTPLDSVFPRGPLVYDEADTLIYVNSIADLLVYDVRTNDLVRITDIEVEEVGDPIDLRWSSTGDLLYLLNGQANQQSSIVEVFERGTVRKVAELDVESVPRAIALSSDGSDVYVCPSEPLSRSGGNYIIRFDAETYLKKQFIKALGRPGERGLVATPDGGKIYLIAENRYYISDNPYGNLRHDVQVIDL
jgi:DNA-binding beta-propeller fold protein YncE